MRGARESRIEKRRNAQYYIRGVVEGGEYEEEEKEEEGKKKEGERGGDDNLDYRSSLRLSDKRLNSSFPIIFIIIIIPPLFLTIFSFHFLPIFPSFNNLFSQYFLFKKKSSQNTFPSCRCCPRSILHIDAGR